MIVLIASSVHTLLIVKCLTVEFSNASVLIMYYLKALQRK